LIVDGRVPFSRIAAVVGVSEQTVSRRYRRMHAAGIVRVAGMLDSQRFGQSDWVVRLQCVPDAAASMAGALARRPDTSWVSLMSGGTEISCVVKPAGGRSRHDLLLRQLPASRRIVSMSAQSILHVFRGGASHWPGASQALSPEQEAMLAAASASATPALAAPSADGPPAAVPYPRPQLGPGDRILLAELARDGRASYAEIASAVRWHESTVRRRVEELRAAGILYLDVDIDASAYGINTHAGMYLSVTPARLADVGKAVAQHPEVPFVGATSGKSNLIATVLCRDDYDLYRYLTERIAGLDGVTAVETALIIRTAKRAAAVLEPERDGQLIPAG
jgi:DNA-binding Lrp family transcriptional regulator